MDMDFNLSNPDMKLKDPAIQSSECSVISLALTKQVVLFCQGSPSVTMYCTLWYSITSVRLGSCPAWEHGLGFMFQQQDTESILCSKPWVDDLPY